MQYIFEQYTPYWFPIFFVLLWLLITTVLGFLSGWYRLMQQYPNCEEKALLQINHQSGFVGWVGMRGILNIGVCSSGVRISIMKIFGPFCRDFFVPWNEISVKRKDYFFWQTVTFQFGKPSVGKLSIDTHIADKIARVSLANWLEDDSLPEETKQQAFLSIIKEWMAMTFFAALCFTIMTRIALPNTALPSIAMTVFFPAVVFGIINIFRYFIRIRR